MWQKRTAGILGVWIIVLAFLDFSVSLTKILLVVTGVFIVLVSFWGKRFIHPTKEVKKQAEAEQKAEQTE